MGDVADLERLEKLLNKPRTVRNRELVRAVMVQPIGITDRIERIEMVDLLAEDPPLPELPSKPRGNLVRPTPHRQENKPKSPPPPPANQASSANSAPSLTIESEFNPVSKDPGNHAPLRRSHSPYELH